VKRLSTVLLVAALVAGGCGGGSAGPSLGGSPPTPAAHTIDPNFDTGQTVLLTAHGVRPKWLVSFLKKPVVFRNTSSTTKRVVFDHMAVDSGPIAPGGVFVFRPKLPASLTYHVGSVRGNLQVSPLNSAAP
jgi:hypothetical protein